jgi:hypothetical protein
VARSVTGRHVHQLALVTEVIGLDVVADSAKATGKASGGG